MYDEGVESNVEAGAKLLSGINDAFNECNIANNMSSDDILNLLGQQTFLNMVVYLLNKGIRIELNYIVCCDLCRAVLTSSHKIMDKIQQFHELWIVNESRKILDSFTEQFLHKCKERCKTNSFYNFTFTDVFKSYCKLIKNHRLLVDKIPLDTIGKFVSDNPLNTNIEKKSSQFICNICYEKMPVILLPCGHNYQCSLCTIKLSNKCAVCRKKVDEKIKHKKNKLLNIF